MQNRQGTSDNYETIRYKNNPLPLLCGVIMKALVCILLAILIYAGHLAIIKVSALIEPITLALEVMK